MVREDVLKNAISLLGVTFPVDASEFKIAYRRACFLHHPDRNGNEEVFKKIQEIYNSVKDDSTLIKESSRDSNILTTEEGILLTKLGLGLGPIQNGKDCEKCSSKGYTTKYEQKWGECPTCKGSGRHSHSCRSCKGSGKFTLKSGRIVDCRDCQGSGRFFPKPKVRHSIWDYIYESNWCNICRGSGKTIVDNVEKLHYYTCTDCEGAGEIPIYNPVIPKGSLGFQKKRR